jgi:hypothetical protein
MQTSPVIVSQADSSVISNSYVTGNVSGSDRTGGLVGSNYLSTITKSYSAGSVIGNSNNVGGLVGYNNTSTLNDNYSTGSVIGSGNNIGGLVGNNNTSSSITNSYSTGSVSQTGTSIYIGGLVGSNSSSTVSNCFWDTVASGRSTSAGGTGKTTAEMKISSTFVNAGWSVSVWFMDSGINNGYPYLSWQNPGGTPVPVEKGIKQLPEQFSLRQNYPNPFNPSTTISFTVPERSQVTLKIYDVLGKEVATLLNNETITGGNHHAERCVLLSLANRLVCSNKEIAVAQVIMFLKGKHAL